MGCTLTYHGMPIAIGQNLNPSIAKVKELNVTNNSKVIYLSDITKKQTLLLKIKSRANLIMKYLKKNKISIFAFLLAVSVCLTSPGVITHAATAQGGYGELTRFVNLVNYVIGMIRWGTTVVAGLYTTVIGWNMLTAERKGMGGLENAKKEFKNAIWALIIVFSAGTLMSFASNKLSGFF